MGCSRRLADLRFRETTGHTILDEIHEVRLARVKELLFKSRRMLSALPDLCGYSSLDDLRRVFKRRVGIPMRQFTKR
jgi:AraC-like DNA-binding protein